MIVYECPCTCTTLPSYVHVSKNVHVCVCVCTCTFTWHFPIYAPVIKAIDIVFELEVDYSKYDRIRDYEDNLKQDRKKLRQQIL